MGDHALLSNAAASTVNILWPSLVRCRRAPSAKARTASGGRGGLGRRCDMGWWLAAGAVVTPASAGSWQYGALVVRQQRVNLAVRAWFRARVQLMAIRLELQVQRVVGRSRATGMCGGGSGPGGIGLP
jgi:hypothetical protein